MKTIANKGLFMGNKKLSIITICYNDIFVEKTCESVVNQTWQDFEWIVIDGGSNSDIQSIYEKYKYRMDKFISEKDDGIYDAYNKGLRLATGEYINLLNSGDYYYDEKVLEDVFGKNNFNEDLICGDTNNISNENDDGGKIYKNYKKFKVTDLLYRFFNTQSLFMKRKLFDKYGLFNTKYKIEGDLDVILKFVVNKSSYRHVDRVIVNYDRGGLSSQHNLKAKAVREAERAEILPMYYTKKQLEEAAMRQYVPTYNFFEKIFSVKKTTNNEYKIITILGNRVNIKINKV